MELRQSIRTSDLSKRATAKTAPAGRRSDEDTITPDAIPEPVEENVETDEVPVDPIIPGQTNAGIQPGGGYEAIYPMAIALYFGSSGSPNWDQELKATIDQEAPKVSKAQLWEQTNKLWSEYSTEMYIPELKAKRFNSRKLITKQYNEISQLFFSLKRNMGQGNRSSTVGVELASLQQFGSLLAPAPGSLANDTVEPAAPEQETTSVTTDQQAVEDAVQPSLTTKVFLAGAKPLGEVSHWKGEYMSASIPEMDSLRRSSMNTGFKDIQRIVGGHQPIVVPQSLTGPKIKVGGRRGIAATGRSFYDEQNNGTFRLAPITRPC